MKALFVPLMFVATFLISCSSSKQMSSTAQDDVYVTTTPPSPEPSVTGSGSDQYSNSYDQGQKSEDSYQSPDYTTTDQYSDANGTTYVTNNYYYGGSGWYNSMMNGPYVGFNYYDPFYYSPGFSISFGIGFGYYNPWYYNPWYYNPYYGGYAGYGYWGWYAPYYPYYPYYPGCGYGWGGCGYGYYDPYGCGGYYGSYPYYGYYGYRGASASNTGNGYDAGRHYKSEDNVQTGSGSNIGNTPVTEGSAAGTIGRSLVSGGVKQNSGGVNSISNSGREKDDVKLNLQNHSNQIDRSIQKQSPSFDRNNAVPERNISSPRNDGNVKQPRNLAMNNPEQIQTYASASNARVPAVVKSGSVENARHYVQTNPNSPANQKRQYTSKSGGSNYQQGTVSRAGNSDSKKSYQHSSASRNYSSGGQLSKGSGSTSRSYSGSGNTGGSRPSHSGGGSRR